MTFQRKNFEWQNIVHGIQGFCFLVIAQTFIQANIFIDVNNTWKSLSIFHLIQEKRIMYYLLYDRESTIRFLIVSVGGSFSYALPNKYSWILVLPWIIHCTVHWISTSFLSIRSLLVAYETYDFWKTGLLLILTIVLKGLLLSEVFMKVLEGILKLTVYYRDIKPLILKIENSFNL